MVRRALTETLEELVAVRVIGWAAAEQEACEKLQALAEAWDVALVDLFLLRGSGLEVMHCLQHRNPQQKVYMVSNYATEAMRKRAAQLGADAVFDKSTELDALMAQLTIAA